MGTPAKDQHVVPEWTQADRLAKARRFAGLSQQELADRLDLGARTINRYEAGEIAKRTVVLSWAMACGVSAEWLLNGEREGNLIPVRLPFANRVRSCSRLRRSRPIR